MINKENKRMDIIIIKIKVKILILEKYRNNFEI
jgi:hypothetical protein